MEETCRLSLGPSEVGAARLARLYNCGLRGCGLPDMTVLRRLSMTEFRGLSPVLLGFVTREEPPFGPVEPRDSLRDRLEPAICAATSSSRVSVG
jgi:hypothetical protein